MYQIWLHLLLAVVDLLMLCARQSFTPPPEYQDEFKYV